MFFALWIRMPATRGKANIERSLARMRTNGKISAVHAKEYRKRKMAAHLSNQNSNPEQNIVPVKKPDSRPYLEHGLNGYMHPSRFLARQVCSTLGSRPWSPHQQCHSISNSSL